MYLLSAICLLLLLYAVLKVLLWLQSRSNCLRLFMSILHILMSQSHFCLYMILTIMIIMSCREIGFMIFSKSPDQLSSFIEMALYQFVHLLPLNLACSNDSC